MPSKTAPSDAFSAGTKNFFIPHSLAFIAIGRTPFTGRTSPLSESSPIKAESLISHLSVPDALSMEMSIGRSYIEPAFLISAGARFTTI